MTPADADSSSPVRYRFWVVPHTHWDREWYLTVESFRIRLGETVDGVIDHVREEPGYRFTLDGQAVLLEDYLQVRPSQGEVIRHLIAQGRVTVGPSYVLPDEYLVGAESLVRNLMHGRQVCWRLGARPSPVGYMPDTFGHVRQLPQIMLGFGIDNFIFTRGLGDEADELGALFRWRAPDGSQVLAIPQLGGYGNAQSLGHRASAAEPPDSGGRRTQTRGENALRTIDMLLERFGHRLERTGLRDVLLCNGIDHEPAQRDIDEVLDECRQLRPDDEFHLATYEDYVSVVRHMFDSLPSFTGELCGGLDENVLRGVNSARMYLKQANELCERELQTTETLCALATLDSDRRRTSYRYPIEELRLAWQELLRNHPHDSICGCSVDEVHEDMQQRFRSARHIARQLRTLALLALAGKPVTWTYDPLSPSVVRPERAQRKVCVLNALPYTRRRVVEVLLPPDLQEAEEIAATTDGRELPVQRVTRDGQAWAAIALTLEGFRSAPLCLDASRPGARKHRPNEPCIENEYLRLEAGLHGGVDVTVKRDGTRLQGALCLVDEGDRGDEYTFCPVEHGALWTSVGVEHEARVVEAGPARQTLEVRLRAPLPAGLAPDDRTRRSEERVDCEVVHELQLVPGVDRLDVRTTVTNLARDHRLRVLVPAVQPGDSVLAEGHFDVLARSPETPHAPHWYEPPHATSHTTGAVRWGSTTIVGRGLPEYEALVADEPRLAAAGLHGPHLALTLLRCVGWLSREDLATRTGGAGPQLPTPDAQCLGRHTFEYSLLFSAQPTPCELVRLSADARHDFLVGPDGVELDGLLDVDTDACFSTLKAAEDGVGLVVRLFNPSGRSAATARIAAGSAVVRLSRLDETVVEPANENLLEIPPGAIITARVLAARTQNAR